ncbi:MAG: TRAP transporter substrate-binding protein DctP [Elusimicrobiales bacterium]
MTCFKIALIAAALAVPAQAQTVIKFATLAPEGSTWMKEMGGFAADAEKATAGRVKFRMYAGGVQGDEKDVLRKIRLGQLHAGGFTGVGIGEAAPKLRVMDSPFLFKSSAEVDYINKLYDAEFRKYLEDGGFVLLGWADVGFVHMFTNEPVRAPEDLKKTKMWIWEGDPIAAAAFKAMNVSPVPLSITDVMTSLQTGLINGVYGSPLSVVALQWFLRVKYMFALPIANAAGAVLVSKKAFDRLSPEDKKTLLELGARHFAQLTEQSRRDNKSAEATLKKQKIAITEPAGPEVVARFEAMGLEARKSLAGRLYPAELLERIEKSLAERRKPAAK